MKNFTPALWLFIPTLMISCSHKSHSNRRNAKVVNVSLERIIGEWPARPRLAVQQMIDKYGAPSGFTSDNVIWSNPGAFKRIVVSKTEIPHDFPLPHMDYLEHTINYMVPADKADDLLSFDGSLTIHRTAGELSARCDLEEHNLLALNLAHDIIRNNKPVADARKELGQMVLQDFAGNHPPYTELLQFNPHTPEQAMFVDNSSIPGAPIRIPAAQQSMETNADSEIMGKVLASDLNEILTAAVTTRKDVNEKIHEYAVMLQKAHGLNQQKTLALGRNIGMRPTETPEVDEMKKDGANELARIISLKGEDFEIAYINSMIRNHIDVLNMIDNELLPEAKNEALKAHLKVGREQVASHLQRAKEIKATF